MHKDISTKTTLCGALWAGTVQLLTNPRKTTVIALQAGTFCVLLQEKAECQNREAFSGINTKGILRSEHLLIHMFLLKLLFSLFTMEGKKSAL